MRMMPNWLFEIYAKAWKKFGSRSFTSTDFKILLARDRRENPRYCSAILSKLDKFGVLLKIRKKDKKRVMYKIVNPTKWIEKLVKYI